MKITIFTYPDSPECLEFHVRKVPETVDAPTESPKLVDPVPVEEKGEKLAEESIVSAPAEVPKTEESGKPKRTRKVKVSEPETCESEKSTKKDPETTDKLSEYSHANVMHRTAMMNLINSVLGVPFSEWRANEELYAKIKTFLVSCESRRIYVDANQTIIENVGEDLKAVI